MNKNIAYSMRPESLDDVIGQKHLVGENKILRRMVEENHPVSMILFGPPGIGKTTIAKCLAHDLDKPYRLFNASSGNKKEMDQIIIEAKMSDGLFVIIDEIHRLNKDKQDHLLPHVESGLLTIVGCTTSNPFHSINPAIRSRCALFEVLPLNKEDIVEAINHALIHKQGLNNEYTIDDNAKSYIASLSSGDIRYAYNLLELAAINTHTNHISMEDVEAVSGKANIQFNKDEDDYYDTLSGFQKSIRGSDVNGALYYLAKLIEAGDFDSIERRLITTAYEDIGLANPNACMRTSIALEAAKKIGFPEARIPISHAVIDLCLSPKSKSSEASIDEAMKINKQTSYHAPDYIRLTPVNKDPDYLYDYSRPDIWEYIQYLPDELKQAQFYVPWLTSKYENALYENYKRIMKHGRTNNIKKLKERKGKD